MIKKAFITMALVSLAIFAFGTAQAAIVDGLANSADTSPTSIFVNPGGLGDALIFGYYNVKGGNLNFLRIVNTSTNQGIGGKIRFREGKNSNEVLDFFVCLSAGDQWSAWIVDGGTGPAYLAYWDNDTPTYPDPQRDDDATNNLTATSFATEPFHYSATGAASSVTINDTKEGYIEFIANVAWPDTPGDNKTVKKPSQCRDKVINLASSTEDATNALAGNLYIFNIGAGAGTYAYNATALANFRTGAAFAGSLANDSTPRLSDATEGLNAVNFILTKSVEFATYDLQFDGATTIINTFPTKRLSIELDPVGVTNGPFRDDAEIQTDGTIKNRCETVNIKIWDDAEHSPTTTEDVSPRPREEQFQKCNEVSIVVVGSTASPLLTTDLRDITVPDSGFDLGWVSEDFITGFPTRTTTVGNVTVQGLPVISYELQGFVDGYLTHMLPLRYSVSYSVQTLY